jgi:hypothetical protein
MPITLRCPECGKVYRIRDDLAGKQAKCQCGAVMKIPADAASKDEPAWEDEVIRALDPSTAAEPPSAPPKKTEPAPAQPPTDSAPGKPASRAPQEPDRKASPSRWRILRYAKIDLRSLLRTDPWRAVLGLAAVVYGSATAVMLLSGITVRSLGDVLFGETTARLAQAALAVAMALGGVLILNRDSRGPACAGLAAALFCVVPMWGIFPNVRDALRMEQFLPLLWVAAKYAVPIALVVWCLKEETRRERREERE